MRLKHIIAIEHSDVQNILEARRNSVPFTEELAFHKVKAPRAKLYNLQYLLNIPWVRHHSRFPSFWWQPHSPAEAALDPGYLLLLALNMPIKQPT